MAQEILNLLFMCGSKKILMCSLIVFFALNIFSQNKVTFENRFENLITLINDTVKADSLYNLGFSLRAEDPMLSFACAKEILKCALELNNKKYEAKAYNLAGILNYRAGEFDKALEYHTKAMHIRDELKDLSELARSYTNLGNVYSDLENFEQSEKFHLKALSAFSKLKDQKQILNCLCNLGVLKHAQKQISPAIQNFNKALSLAEKMNDYESRAMCCNNLGVIYEEEKNWEMALNYYFEEIKLNEQMGTHGNLSESYFNVGSVYTAMKKNEEAQIWLNKAIDIAKKYEHTETQIMILDKMSEVKAQIGDFKYAYDLLTQKKLLNTEVENVGTNNSKKGFVFPDEYVTDKNGFQDYFNHFFYFLLGVLITIIMLFSFTSKKNKKIYEQKG